MCDSAGNRAHLEDVTDPGGRLGPTNGCPGDQEPDLRNLALHLTACEDGDIVFILTDGVYDNFDPELRGLTPRDLGV